MNTIQHAIAIGGGITAFTRLLNAQLTQPVSYQAVRKWAAKGRLPRTDWTGESDYAGAIERALSGRVSAEQLRARPAEPANSSTEVV